MIKNPVDPDLLFIYEYVKRRGTIEIVHDVLLAIHKVGEIKNLHLLGYANISHAKLKPVLDTLVKNDYVKITKKKRAHLYSLTNSGLELMRFLDKIAREFYGN